MSVYEEIMGGLQEAAEFEQGKRELRTKVVKDLEHYMSLDYKVEIREDEYENGYVTSIPELKGCITCAKDREAALVKLEDAKREWIIAALESGIKIPEPDCKQQDSGLFNLSFLQGVTMPYASAEHYGVVLIILVDIFPVSMN